MTYHDRMLGVALQPGDTVSIVRGEREIVRASIEPPYYPPSMMLYVDAQRPTVPELTDGRPVDATEPLGEPEPAHAGGGLFGGGRAARHGR